MAPSGAGHVRGPAYLVRVVPFHSQRAVTWATDYVITLVMKL